MVVERGGYLGTLETFYVAERVGISMTVWEYQASCVRQKPIPEVGRWADYASHAFLPSSRPRSACAAQRRPVIRLSSLRLP
jgi:hypothetical protein